MSDSGEPRPWFSVCRECTPPVLANVGPLEVTITLPASPRSQQQRLGFFLL